MIHELDTHQKNSLLDVLVTYMKADVPIENRDNPQWDNFLKALKPLGIGRLKGDIIAFWINSQCRNARKHDIKIRLLHPVEKEIITPEAYGYLLELHRIGMLSAPIFEDVVNQCMLQTSLPVTREQAKSVVANTLGQIFADLEIQNSH